MKKYIQIMAIYYVINFVFVLTYCIMEKINLERKVYCYHRAEYRKCLHTLHDQRTVSITKASPSSFLSASPFHIFHCWFFLVFLFSFTIHATPCLAMPSSWQHFHVHLSVFFNCLPPPSATLLFRYLQTVSLFLHIRKG